MIQYCSSVTDGMALVHLGIDQIQHVEQPATHINKDERVLKETCFKQLITVTGTTALVQSTVDRMWSR